MCYGVLALVYTMGYGITMGHGWYTQWVMVYLGWYTRWAMVYTMGHGCYTQWDMVGIHNVLWCTYDGIHDGLLHAACCTDTQS